MDVREELEQDILTTARDIPSGATPDLLSRHPRDEVMAAISELFSEGFVSAVPGEALLHDLEHAD